jgi:hypothetical protein
MLKEGTEGEFLADRADGKVALGVSYKGTENTARWVFRPKDVPGLTLTPGKRYEATVEYKTDTGCAGWVALDTLGDRERVGGAQLPTSGAWTKVTFAFAPREGTELQFSFGTDGEVGRFLRIGAFEIADPSGGAGRDVFRLSAAELPLFRNTKTGFDVDSGEQPELGKGVFFAAHRPDTAAEYFCAVTDGQKALGWANLKGEPTGQLGIELEAPPGQQNGAATGALVAGRKYRTSVTYKTAGGTKGGLYYQTQQTYESWESCGRDLPDTSGEWRTASFVTTKPAKPVRLLVDNHGTGADKVFFVRELIVTEAEAVTAAPGKSLYALDLSAQKPFRDRGRTRAEPNGNWVWGSAEKTGAGALPAGWTGYPWKLEDEAEYFAEEVDGKMALGFATVRGQGSAMLLAPPVAFSTGKAQLTVEYRTPRDQTVNLFTKFQRTQPTAERARDLTALAGTNGEWRTETVEVDLRGATAGLFELHNNHGPGMPIHVRGLTVTESEPRARAAPLQLDFGALKEGTFALGSGAPGTPSGRTNIGTPGWWADAHRPGAAGDSGAGADGGTRRVTLLNKTGSGSVRLFPSAPGPALVGGRQ